MSSSWCGSSTSSCLIRSADRTCAGTVTQAATQSGVPLGQPWCVRARRSACVITPRITGRPWRGFGDQGTRACGGQARCVDAPDHGRRALPSFCGAAIRAAGVCRREGRCEDLRVRCRLWRGGYAGSRFGWRRAGLDSGLCALPGGVLVSGSGQREPSPAVPGDHPAAAVFVVRSMPVMPSR